MVAFHGENIKNRLKANAPERTSQNKTENEGWNYPKK